MWQWSEFYHNPAGCREVMRARQEVRQLGGNLPQVLFSIDREAKMPAATPRMALAMGLNRRYSIARIMLRTTG